jgi:hypothetical protein
MWVVSLDESFPSFRRQIFFLITKAVHFFQPSKVIHVKTWPYIPAKQNVSLLHYERLIIHKCSPVSQWGEALPIKGLVRPLGYQEAEVSTISSQAAHESCKSALGNGRLYPQKAPLVLVLEAESNPGTQGGRRYVI